MVLVAIHCQTLEERGALKIEPLADWKKRQSRFLHLLGHSVEVGSRKKADQQCRKQLFCKPTPLLF